MRYHYEKVLPGEGRSFKTENVRGPVVDCVFHVHPEFELTYVESSFGVRFIGDNIGEFGEDDLVLVGKMLPHHYFNSPNDSRGPIWSRLKVIKFREDFAGRDLFCIKEFYGIQRMLDDAAHGLVFAPNTARSVRPFIYRLFETDGAMRVIMFLELLSRLAAAGYTQLSTNIIKSEAMAVDDRLNRVLEYIHSRLSINASLSLAGASKTACMTPQAFSQYFHRITRRRFIDYVNELKIGRACGLLADTNLTIMEISTDSGYNNLSNFNRHFRKLKGISPREYRNKYRLS